MAFILLALVQFAKKEQYQKIVAAMLWGTSKFNFFTLFFSRKTFVVAYIRSYAIFLQLKTSKNFLSLYLVLQVQ